MGASCHSLAPVPTSIRGPGTHTGPRPDPTRLDTKSNPPIPLKHHTPVPTPHRYSSSLVDTKQLIMISSESSDDEMAQVALQKPVVSRRTTKKRKIQHTSTESNENALSNKSSVATEAAREASQAAPTRGDHSSLTAEASPDATPEKTREELRKEKKLLKQKRKQEAREQLEKEKQQALEQARKLHGRPYTLSVAIPGSIIDNAQTKELKTYLAGQIARAAVIFQVDELVVFDDQLGHLETTAANASAAAASKSNSAANCHVFLARILQYLDTPQYLRKMLFPMHADLQFAGLLNPLDCPHHLRQHEWSEYREGAVVDRPVQSRGGDAAGKNNPQTSGSVVYAGLQKNIFIDKKLQPGVRVTVKIDETTKNSKKMHGTVVSSAEPREQTGVYWGYTTRSATSLHKVWKECPFKDGYDLKIGTSERGHVSVDDDDFKLPSFRHVLVVFGGVAGIEECVNADETIPVSGEDSHTLFDMWVNTCPSQGSRTIRTEEAMLISLAALRPHIKRSGR